LLLLVCIFLKFRKNRMSSLKTLKSIRSKQHPLACSPCHPIYKKEEKGTLNAALALEKTPTSQKRPAPPERASVPLSNHPLVVTPSAMAAAGMPTA
jgi:hypothetical protein